MCTLTVLRSKDGSVITMTRDERRDRTEVGALIARNNLIYPLDESSQGTWFGLNDDGVVLALLNRYQQSHQTDRLSRGEIIPQALAQFSPVLWLSELDPSAYNPFDLFCISDKQVWHFQWNGEHSDEGYKMSEVPVQQGFVFSSSSFMTDQVLAYRKGLFRQWLQSIAVNRVEEVANSVLEGFHLGQEAGCETHAVLMERELTHSKSISQVELKEKWAGFKYFPEALANGLGLIQQAELERNITRLSENQASFPSR